MCPSAFHSHSGGFLAPLPVRYFLTWPVCFLPSYSHCGCAVYIFPVSLAFYTGKDLKLTYTLKRGLQGRKGAAWGLGFSRVMQFGLRTSAQGLCAEDFVPRGWDWEVHTPEKVRPSGEFVWDRERICKGTVGLWTIFLPLFYFLSMGWGDSLLHKFLHIMGHYRSQSNRASQLGMKAKWTI